MKAVHKLIDVETRFGGWLYLAKTNLGNEVNVWIAPQNKKKLPATSLTAEHNRRAQKAHQMFLKLSGSKGRGALFCHGHSLDTFQKYGYSVYGGDGLEQVSRRRSTAGPRSQPIGQAPHFALVVDTGHGAGAFDD